LHFLLQTRQAELRDLRREVDSLYDLAAFDTDYHFDQDAVENAFSDLMADFHNAEERAHVLTADLMPILLQQPE
jgi:formate-dependent nitrite reductase cytochrome c552 subunit